MIIGCVNAYQDARFLGVSLPHLRDRVDRLIVVDGAYRDFKSYGESPTSNDESQEIARYFDAEVLPAIAGLDEPQKRSRYFVGKPGDWYIVVDADEIIEGANREELRRALDVAGREADDYAIAFCESAHPWEAKHRTVFRVHKHRDGMRYHGTHHALHVPGADGVLRMPVKPTEAPKFGAVLLRHLTMTRPAERMDRKAAYLQKLGATEREFRAANGL